MTCRWNSLHTLTYIKGTLFIGSIDHWLIATELNKDHCHCWFKLLISINLCWNHNFLTINKCIINDYKYYALLWYNNLFLRMVNLFIKQNKVELNNWWIFLIKFSWYNAIDVSFCTCAILIRISLSRLIGNCCNWSWLINYIWVLTYNTFTSAVNVGKVQRKNIPRFS